MYRSPCKDCLDRKLLCHGQCKRYQEFRNELEARKAENGTNFKEIPEGVLHQYWRSLRYSYRKYNKK